MGKVGEVTTVNGTDKNTQELKGPSLTRYPAYHSRLIAYLMTKKRKEELVADRESEGNEKSHKWSETKEERESFPCDQSTA